MPKRGGHSAQALQFHMSRASCYESFAQRRLRLRCLVLYSEKVKMSKKNDHERCGQSVGCVRREPQSLPHFRTNKMAGVGRACEPTWAWASRGSWGRPLGRAPAASPCAPRSRSWADRACTRVPCTCLESRLHRCPVRVAPGQQQQSRTSAAATTALVISKSPFPFSKPV